MNFKKLIHQKVAMHTRVRSEGCQGGNALLVVSWPGTTCIKEFQDLSQLRISTRASFNDLTPILVGSVQISITGFTRKVVLIRALALEVRLFPVLGMNGRAWFSLDSSRQRGKGNGSLCGFNGPHDILNEQNQGPIF